MNRFRTSLPGESTAFRPNLVHHFLIITSGSESHLCADGTVDRLIRLAQELKKNPVLVLGPEGDEVLLHSRLAEKCELAFDPNFSGNIFSSLQAGLHASSGPVLAMTLQAFSESCKSQNSESPFHRLSPESDLWKFLESRTLELSARVHPEAGLASDLFAATPMPSVNFLRTAPPFPLGVTSAGAVRLKDLPAATEFHFGSELRISVADPVANRVIRCPLLDQAAANEALNPLAS